MDSGSNEVAARFFQTYDRDLLILDCQCIYDLCKVIPDISLVVLQLDC